MGAVAWTQDQLRGLVVQFASVSITSSGDNTIVAADTTNKIKLLSAVLIADSPVAVKWKSGAGTDLSGAMSLASQGGIVYPPVAPSAGHYLETAVNAILILNLSAAIGVRGHITYVKEP